MEKRKGTVKSMTFDFCNNWTFRKEGGVSVSVNLPHDAMLLEKRDGGCRNGVNSGYFPGGRYTYEKAFELDAAMLGKSVVLHFEGVYQNCKVYANRKLAGSHRYGYTAFDVDISDFVQSGENTVRVEVDNSLEPNCRWYSGSGIYRPVQLLIREKNHITQVHLETVDIHPAKLRVDVQTTQESAITVEVYEGKKLVASGKPGILEVPEAKLWSGDNPFLYTVLVKTDTDERVIPFGIRKLEWSAKTGMPDFPVPRKYPGGSLLVLFLFSADLLPHGGFLLFLSFPGHHLLPEHPGSQGKDPHPVHPQNVLDAPFRHHHRHGFQHGGAASVVGEKHYGLSHSDGHHVHDCDPAAASGVFLYP